MALGVDYSSSGPRLDDRARAELRARAEEIVRCYLGEPNPRLSNSREMRWGSRGSFGLNVQGDKAGLWFDHENGCGGDIIEFIRQQRGCSIGEAIDEALTYLGPSASWSSSTAPKPIAAGQARRGRRGSDRSGAAHLVGSSAGAWDAGRAVSLRSRHPVGDEALDVLGFHRHCPFGDRRRAPALVALVQDIITGEPIAIHRRELTPNAAKAGSWRRPAPRAAARSGSAVPIAATSPSARASRPALAGLQLGFGPTWSVIDAGGMTAFPVLDHVGRLTIMADNDVSETRRAPLRHAAIAGRPLARPFASRCRKSPAKTSTTCCSRSLRSSMRELRGVIIEETETGAGMRGAMPVEVARDVLRAVIEQLMQDALRFHEDATEAQSNPPKRKATGSSTGPRSPIIRPFASRPAGKSEATRAAAAATFARRRNGRRAPLPPPTFARRRNGACSASPSTYRRISSARRRASGTPHTSPRRCCNRGRRTILRPASRFVLTWPQSKPPRRSALMCAPAACRKPRRGGDPILCQFYETCGYQRQKQKAKQADIVFAAHHYLFGPPEVLTKDVGVVVIDEGFWQSGLSFSKLAVDGLDAELQAFPVRDHSGDKNSDDTNHLADMLERLKSAVKASPVGEYLTKAALLAAGLLPCEKYENGGSNDLPRTGMAAQGRCKSVARRRRGDFQKAGEAIRPSGTTAEARRHVASRRGIAVRPLRCDGPPAHGDQDHRGRLGSLLETERTARHSPAHCGPADHRARRDLEPRHRQALLPAHQARPGSGGSGTA